MKFEKLQLSDVLIENLHGLGFFRTTDIQYKAIPSILRGEDVLAIAQTGTGKTAAFAIPLVDMIQKGKSSKRSEGLSCLIMVPTRELAQQIGGVFNSLCVHTKVKAFALFGGVEQDRQIQKLQEGLDILITTPGRMFDLISQGFIDLHDIEFLVLDEADQMLDLGFIEDIEAIKRKLPRKHQTLFFSATINPQIKKLAYSQVRSNAIRIQISPEDPVSKNITHFVIPVKMDDKRFFLVEYLKQNPEGKFIIFVRTKVRAERVAKVLLRAEVQSLTLHGDKDQSDRDQVMKSFRLGDVPILIATDISARGIDVPNVTHVLNYDLPEKPENYVHRIGRTGRGFNKGLAVSFCAPEEAELLNDIEALIGKSIEKLKVNSHDYKAIVETPQKEMSFAEMIELEESLIMAAKRKKKKK